MEEVNSKARLHLSPAESMQKLQKACYASDVRLRIRVDQMAQARLLLGGAFLVPATIYFLYHTFAPWGVMHNFRASNGAYLYWM